MKFILVGFCIATLTLLAFRVEAETDMENEVLRYDRCSTASCPNVWKPVCATNNRCTKKFNNSCLLRMKNCKTSLRERYNIVPNRYCKNAKPC